ncbi:MAG: hypothetical protein ABIU77_23295, partial [Ferruginibacter sp.]
KRIAGCNRYLGGYTHHTKDAFFYEARRIEELIGAQNQMYIQPHLENVKGEDGSIYFSCNKLKTVILQIVIKKAAERITTKNTSRQWEIKLFKSICCLT